MKEILKFVFTRVHRILAPGPKIIVRLYIESISSLCRRLPRSWTTHIQSSVSGHALPWSQREFPPRAVEVGVATKILLTPHLGEFDEAALFTTRMDYEHDVFVWLAQNASRSYDIVVEIGANVGIYTCFLDALIKAAPQARLKEVVAFEPSAEAYRRLLNNLAANGASTVRSFNAAVASGSGFCTFFEPRNHLTNGSFLKDFAQIFSGDIDERLVLAVGPADLGGFLKGRRQPLIKVDVESYEATLLGNMAEIIDAHHPDFLIEVLAESVAGLEAIEALRPYRRCLITRDGLRLHPRLFPDETSRDWLLIHPGSLVPIDTGSSVTSSSVTGRDAAWTLVGAPSASASPRPGAPPPGPRAPR